MKHQAKATSSESNQGASSRLAEILGVFATHGVSGGATGSDSSSVRSFRRRLLIPAVLLALSAAAALTGGAILAFAANPPKIEECGVEETNQEPRGVYATRAHLFCNVEPAALNQPTGVSIEYATSEGGPWTVALDQIVEKKEASRGSESVEVVVRHLTPETKYYVHITASSPSSGSASKSFDLTTTAVGAPEIVGAPAELGPGWVKVGAGTTFANAEAAIEADGADTEYQLEVATGESGPWSLVPGTHGSVTAAQEVAAAKGKIEGLTPETGYFVRLKASNEKGTIVIGRTCPPPPEGYCESPGEAKGEFKTASVHPQVYIKEPTAVTGVSAHLQGSVYAQTYETSWRFEYATSAGGPWTPVPGGSGTIAAEAGEGAHEVEADLAGLHVATGYSVRLFAESAKGTATANTGFETAGPPLAETFATHALDGEEMRALGSVDPHGLETHYHFDYVSQEQFAQTGWAEASSTPEVEGSGNVGADLPGLRAGETYHYRLLASNECEPAEHPGRKCPSEGKEQTLKTPVPGKTQGGGEEAQPNPCPNEQFRTGLSAHLSDCRAYEQLTPVEKEGAYEPFNRLEGVFTTSTRFGEDGNHFMIEASNTNWGSGQSPYFFARGQNGWQMTAAAAQPEAGVGNYRPGPASPDLTMTSLRTSWQTASGTESSDTEFKVGPPGGPYTTAASIPRSQAGGGGAGSISEGWVAASEDFSKLILQVPDHTLVGPTGTKSGSDLYEYAEGQTRQVNVLTSGVTIGSCGATIVLGLGVAENATHGNPPDQAVSSFRAVSADGSRVFFEAVPGGSCSGEAKHLYMRVRGSETVDIGQYTFLAANAAGSKVLLEKISGGAHELLIYDVESELTKLLVTVNTLLSVSVSDDFNAIYLVTSDRLGNVGAPAGGGLYRYDIPSETLHYAVPELQAGHRTVSADGRYYYFDVYGVSAVPGGGAFHRPPNGPPEQSLQLFRYDSGENVVECVSCASPFNPEPKLGLGIAPNDGEQGYISHSGDPVISANGDYAFFETLAALVPQDLNGEIPTPHSLSEGGSPSWDVYEWRKGGVDGCAHVQGCVSLITPGTDGVLVALIGATASGSDVFFTTHSSLVPQDNDTSGDVYDARIGGGFPTAGRPVECEGDTCSTAASPPNDATPSSFTFQGAGNLGATLAEVKPKPKPKQCKKGYVKKKGKCVKKPKAKKASHKRRAK